MKPLDFISHAAQNDCNKRAIDIISALSNKLEIHGERTDFEVLSYYYANGKMHLDIEPMERKTRKSKDNYKDGKKLAGLLDQMYQR